MTRPGRCRRCALSAARRGPVLAVAVLLWLCLPAAATAHRIGGIVPDVPTGTHLQLRHPAMAHAAALDYQGGPVLHWNRSHLIFWAPAGSGLGFDPTYQALTERFLAAVAADSHRATNVYGLSGQYYDSGGPAAYDSTYGGAVTATDALPSGPSQCVEPSGLPWSACLTDAQLQLEVEHVVLSDGLPRTPNDIYFLVLPDRLGSCTDSTSLSCALGGSPNGYCGYHSDTNVYGLLYAVIPYNAVPGHCQSGNPRPNGSTADPALSTISHEHNEVVTDPQTNNSWIDPSGNETGDLCITQFGHVLGGTATSAWNEVIDGGHYYLQEEWSNEDGGCRPRDEGVPVTFTIPAKATAGKRLSLTAHATDSDGRIVAYNWYFGDGASGRGHTLTHAFIRAGTYRVVLRVTDSADNWASSSRVIRIAPAAAREPRRRTSPLKRR